MIAKGIALNPLFVMRLVHLMRRGRIGEAIELGGSEVQAALDAYEAGDDDQGDEGGIVIVPTPARLLALSLNEPTTKDTYQPKGPRP
jgi:hypothetical protein